MATSSDPKCRVGSPTTPPLHHHHLLLLLLFLLISTAPSPSSSADIPYSPNCNSLVPEPKSLRSPLTDHPLLIRSAHFDGGDRLFGLRPQFSNFSYPRSLRFKSHTVYETSSDSVLRVEAGLVLRGGSFYFGNSSLVSVEGRSPRRPRTRAFVQRGRVRFDLRGYWSTATGRLCMVGSALAGSGEGNVLDLSAVLKLNYPNVSTINTSFVSGNVTSLDGENDPNYFDPIRILAYSQRSYAYTLTTQAKAACNGLDAGVALKESVLCPVLRENMANAFQLEYGNGCVAKNCSPFGFLPDFMTSSGVQCSKVDRKLRFYLRFSNLSAGLYGSEFEHDSMLVAEGFWDDESNRLCAAACRAVKGVVEDCTMGMSLSFSPVLSIKSRSVVKVGLFSTLDKTHPGYFGKIRFQDTWKGWTRIPGLKYEYTMIDRVRNSCGAREGEGEYDYTYPDGYSFEDMRFTFSFEYGEIRGAYGHSEPISVDDRIYGGYSVIADSYGSDSTEYGMSEIKVMYSNHTLHNVSYSIRIDVPMDLKLGGVNSSHVKTFEIAAEGIYNARTGSLCLVGCGGLKGHKVVNENMNALDCEIRIDARLPSSSANSSVMQTNGTIRSTRKKTDPLYFKPLSFTLYGGLYKAQVASLMWRIDFEIIMVLVSLCLSCFLIALQLFHVKRHPDVLPSISVTMLIILTLGYMIPLVLNFEALFFTSHHNKQNVLLWRGGWLEANEVIVRVVTMVAFLLQFRLLQLTWSARSGAERNKGFWAGEWRCLRFCLTVYFIGGLITWFVHWNSQKASPTDPNSYPLSPHSVWDDLISYSGVVLDGFLLPQIMLNLFWNSKVKSLAHSFYIGTTVIRAFPHIYDAFRSHIHVPMISSSYFYANPEEDLYSIAWDIIIPCGGVLFALLIFLQQQFGGDRILPSIFRRLSGYEKVPVTSG
ncbi:hypothetical protein QJS04_geneDACA012838 [Acorus gramineus]|uniref:RING-type E3 ubiquitin transferase n=1 Tax=Acorus gramineus TaxID=55184 RepID=A0AAV9BEA9_ACOGR|nr:hypothetical protein QJS04_geneDACA012838 [Acorus gramineus]